MSAKLCFVALVLVLPTMSTRIGEISGEGECPGGCLVEGKGPSPATAKVPFFIKAGIDKIKCTQLSLNAEKFFEGDMLNEGFAGLFAASHAGGSCKCRRKEGEPRELMFPPTFRPKEKCTEAQCWADYKTILMKWGKERKPEKYWKDGALCVEHGHAQEGLTVTLGDSFGVEQMKKIGKVDVQEILSSVGLTPQQAIEQMTAMQTDEATEGADDGLHAQDSVAETTPTPETAEEEATTLKQAMPCKENVCDGEKAVVKGFFWGEANWKVGWCQTPPPEEKADNRKLKLKVANDDIDRMAKEDVKPLLAEKKTDMLEKYAAAGLYGEEPEIPFDLMKHLNKFNSTTSVENGEICYETCTGQWSFGAAGYLGSRSELTYYRPVDSIDGRYTCMSDHNPARR